MNLKSYTEMLYFNKNFKIDINLEKTEDDINFLKTIRFIQRPKILIEDQYIINKLGTLLNLTYGVDKNNYKAIESLTIKNMIILYTDITFQFDDIENTYICIHNINKLHEDFLHELSQNDWDCVRKISGSYAQLQQDINVINYFNLKKNGYFVDIGAHDGTSLSNTYKLEKDFGWTGICFEPIPDIFEKLIKTRNSININKPVFEKSGISIDFAIKTSDMSSGIKESLDVNPNSDIKEIITLETISLNDALELHNAPNYIEFLSLDTEGSEFEILRGIDFNKYKFGYITVEHNFIEPKRTEIRKLLENNGYKFLMQNRWDDDYILINNPER